MLIFKKILEIKIHLIVTFFSFADRACNFIENIHPLYNV